MTAWPHPHDTSLERARKIARSYRTLAWNSNPEACSALDNKAVDCGQEWVVPRPTGLDLDDLVTIPNLSHMLDVPVGTIRSWLSRGELARRVLNDGTPAVLMREAVELQKQKRVRTRNDRMTS